MLHLDWNLPAIVFIHLGEGVYTRVDSDYLPKLRIHQWGLNNKGYVTAVSRRKRRFRVVRLHRIVTSAPKNSSVHHRNLNKLDNRRANLQVFESEEEHYKVCHESS